MKIDAKIYILIIILTIFSTSCSKMNILLHKKELANVGTILFRDSLCEIPFDYNEYIFVEAFE